MILSIQIIITSPKLLKEEDTAYYRNPGLLADIIGYNLAQDVEEAQEFLEQTNIKKRLFIALELIKRVLDTLIFQQKIAR